MFVIMPTRENIRLIARSSLCYLIVLFQRIVNKWIRHEAHISYAYKLVDPKSPTMTVKLLTEHYFEILSLKGGCTGLSRSILVKIPHCWKSHVTAQI